MITTELQLAALLGKTLLEKNGELEVKLMKLQEFSEDTLATNQVYSSTCCNVAPACITYYHGSCYHDDECSLGVLKFL